MDVRRTLGPAVMIAAAASCGSPGDPIDQSVDELVVCGSGPTVEGIDVSVYQSTVNWPMVRAAGKRFAIARVIHGSTRDTQFDRNWREMRANGLIRGAYIYFDPRLAVAPQANAVIAAVGRLAAGDLPVTLDVEQPPPGLPTPTAYAAMVRDLADRIEVADVEELLAHGAPRGAHLGGDALQAGRGARDEREVVAGGCERASQAGPKAGADSHNEGVRRLEGRVGSHGTEPRVEPRRSQRSRVATAAARSARHPMPTGVGWAHGELGS